MNSINSASNTSPLLEEKNGSTAVTPLMRVDCSSQYGSITPYEDDTPMIESDIKDQSTFGKVYKVLRTLTIEPVIFSYMLAYFMNLACMSNMMMDKGCLYHYNYSPDICNNLTQDEYKDIKSKVEVLATNYNLYFSCMSLIGGFFMMFIAPWSDKYSRKLPLMFALFGATITDLGFIWCSIHFELRNEYLLWSRIPSEIFGGFICVLTIVYSHASEVSTKQFRTVKYALIETAFGSGICMGGLAGGLLYRYYSYVAIYEAAAALHVFCFLWVVFVVEETTGLNSDISWCEKAKDFFVCQSIIDGVKATFRRREGNQRAILLLMMVSMCVIVLTYECFSSINFIYAHHIYNWDPTTYNFVSTTFSLIQLPLTLLLVPALIRIYNIHDYTFGVIGTISMMVKNLLISFAKYHTFIYYLAYAVGVVNGLSTLAIRSNISKVVEKDEIGQVFFFLATSEAIFPIFGTIVLTKIFTASLNITPNIAFLSSVVALLIPLLTFLWAIRCYRRSYVPVTTNENVQVKA